MTAEVAPVRGVDEVLVGFARALRASGVPVTQDRTQGFLDAVAVVGLDDQGATYTAGRATLCGSPDDLVRYDQVFEAYFNARDGLPRARPAQPAVPAYSDLPDDEGTGQGEASQETVRAMASTTEVLRHRDVASMTAAEKHRLAGMLATLRPRPPLRRTPRHRAWHRGRVDASRTLRESLRHDGERLFAFARHEAFAAVPAAIRAARCSSWRSCARRISVPRR